jgi:hypothetical protein
MSATVGREVSNQNTGSYRSIIDRIKVCFAIDGTTSEDNKKKKRQQNRWHRQPSFHFLFALARQR